MNVGKRIWGISGFNCRAIIGGIVFHKDILLFLFFNCSENRFQIFPLIYFFRSSKGEWSWNKHLEYAIPEDLPIVHPFVTRLTISIGNRKFSAMWKSCVLIELLQMYMCSEDGAGIQHSSGFCENILSDVRNFERFSLAHFTDAMENTNLWIFHRQKNH